MEPLDSMKRKSEFKQSVAKPAKYIDSRFGIRRIFLTKQERPRVAQYTRPGKGPNGEHLN
jgi:hypothetical protein